MEPRVFRYSRKSTLSYLVGSVALALLSIAVARGSGEQARMGAWLAGVFALSSVALVWVFICPVVLVLDADGFTVRGGFGWKPKILLWREAGEFFLQSTGRGAVGIAYKLHRAPRDYSHLSDLMPPQNEFKLLPAGWDQTPEQMVAALNSYRSAALSEVSHGASPAGSTTSV